MSVELKVPNVGESVTEVQVGGWLVEPGQHVERDQVVVVIETDKASVEIPAPVSGTVTQVTRQSGAKVRPGEVIGLMEEGAATGSANANASQKPAAEKTAAPEPTAKPTAKPTATPKPPAALAPTRGPTPGRSPAAPLAPAAPTATRPPPHREDNENREDNKVMPAAERLLAENKLKAGDVDASGPGGRLLKEDVQRVLAGKPSAPQSPPQSSPPSSPPSPPQSKPRELQPAEAPAARAPYSSDVRATETVAMSPLRKTIARRLVDAQRTAALLTTFNEVDMHAVVELRKSHGEAFLQEHGVKLGFMSFFVKAVVDALAAVPSINARIGVDADGAPESIVYHHYCDIGVAVGGGKGLVVPVIRNAERLSFAEVEAKIADFAKRAQENKLALDELTGGTFTLSNGGVYGSLLSTPIVNPPQSGVLGLHAIQERPVARDGQVVLRPMMYVALAYDHRLVDGREAVTFLKRVKECVESPARILLEI